MPVAGRRMVEWSIEAFRAAAGVRSIVVACPPGHVHDLGGGDLGVVDGGETRAQSVANALEAVGTQLVVVHDAARPLVTPGLIEAVVATLAADPAADAAIAAVPVTDTIKRAAASGTGRNADEPGRAVPSAGEPGTAIPSAGKQLKSDAFVVEETVDRGGLWAAQTPQAFRVDALRAALERDPQAAAAATDEAMLIEASGGRVLIHEATTENLKITTPLDLELAEALVARRAEA